jgi:broad specificity phosphatase PhoE
VRRLIFVRHGQYDPETGALTGIGRRQARAVARALAGTEIARVYSSTLPRAKETAAIIARALRLRSSVVAMSSLREAIPTPLPGRRISLERRRQIRANFQRMRRAFQRLVRSARGERTELVVAHGNLIRLFVCLALRSKPTTWLKMHVTNGGITVLLVTDRKARALVSYNDVGHLPVKLRTFM